MGEIWPIQPRENNFYIINPEKSWVIGFYANFAKNPAPAGTIYFAKKMCKIKQEILIPKPFVYWLMFTIFSYQRNILWNIFLQYFLFLN